MKLSGIILDYDPTPVEHVNILLVLTVILQWELGLASMLKNPHCENFNTRKQKLK